MPSLSRLKCHALRGGVEGALAGVSQLVDPFGGSSGFVLGYRSQFGFDRAVCVQGTRPEDRNGRRPAGDVLQCVVLSVPVDDIAGRHKIGATRRRRGPIRLSYPSFCLSPRPLSLHQERKGNLLSGSRPTWSVTFVPIGTRASFSGLWETTIPT
jgi:hypothetical protein